MDTDPESARSPFTGAGTTSVWGRLDGRSIYQCPDTGAVFFDREEISESDYQDYGAYPYLEEFGEERINWEVRIRRPKYQEQLDLMENYAPGNTLLDVGAGPGYLCRVAEEEGWAARGVEIAQDAVCFGEEELGVRYVDIEDVEDESIDAITCHHVLEHIPQPMEFLETLRRKLKEEGLLVLHVPHQQPLTFRLRDWAGDLLGGESDTFCTLYGDIHISGFTKASLRTVLKEAGFSPHFTSTTGMWTKYYDPFFAKNYLRDDKYWAMARKFVRHVVERMGEPLGRGDWVVGYFHKANAY
jgi:2-polyprenyl-3-methyl-5-hydroxy-6-metoxy-1,4-benzoquinol methylase